jgi:hypothetical protein
MRRVRAKMHKAAGDIFSEVLQPGLDDGVVGTDFPRDTLRFFIYLAGDRRVLATQDVLASAAYYTILIKSKAGSPKAYVRYREKFVPGS